MLIRKVYFTILFVIAFSFVLVVPMSSQVGSRDIIWAHGATISKGWYDFRREMEWHGFIFNDILTGPLYDDAVVDGILSTSYYLDQRIEQQMGENVLGLGNGFGGIALRYAQLANENISAMVFCGVPNQGSQAILKATQIFNSKSDVQRFLEKIQSKKLIDNCADCNVTGLFKSWADAFANGEFLRDLQPDSDVITNINLAENLPTVPYITLYGTVEDFSMTRMLDTRGSVIDNDALVRCYEQRTGERPKNIYNQDIRSIIRRTSGFFNSVIRYIGELFTKSTDTPSPEEIQTAAKNFIGEANDFIFVEMLAEHDVELELARMLRCQLVPQLQESEWMLMLQGESFYETKINVNVITYEEIELCKLECVSDFANVPNSIHHCLTWCSKLNIGENVPVSVFIIPLLKWIACLRRLKKPNNF